MTTATRTPSPEAWAKSFRVTSDEDPEIRAHGGYFTCSYMLDMTDHSFVVTMESGRVSGIAIDPGPLDVPYQFVIRASAETWRNFGVAVPPPMYHGIWSCTFQRDMRLEGNVLALMQNLRCITKQIELLRIVGVPV